MSHRLNEYFASEASEYLDQLDRLLTMPGAPETDQFLRLSTGVRGSAQMAGAATLASVAERLEDAARSILSSNIAWSEEIRAISRETVNDLKILVRALNRWGEAEERRVREAISRWEDVDADDVPDTPGAPPVVPVSDLFYDDEGPHILEESTRPEGGDRGGVAPLESEGVEANAAASSGEGRKTVGIETLLYRGDDALKAALALRPDVHRSLDQLGEGVDARLGELLDELFDLVELGLSPEPPEA